MAFPALLSLLLATGTVLQGLARSDCAPWDGPAFTVLLPVRTASSTEGFPLRISIWEAAAIEAPRDFRFPRDARLGAAVLEPPRGQAQLLKGSVHFDKAVPGTAVRGRFDLTAPQGGRFRGSFAAPWRAVQTRCG
jgi:hypothetical protein